MTDPKCPIEVYPLVRDVAGIDPGMYYYNVEHHSVELLNRLAPEQVQQWTRIFAPRQPYFETAPVVFAMTARFHRSFWRYRTTDVPIPCY